MGLFDFFKSKDDDESKIGIPSDERTSSFMRPLAFDEENNLFILEDKALAFAFQCLPLNGTSDGLQEPNQRTSANGVPARHDHAVLPVSVPGH